IAVGVIVLLGLFYFLLKPGSQPPRGLPPITPAEWLVYRVAPQDRSAPGLLWRSEYFDTRVVVVVIGAILLIGLLVMWVDAYWLRLPVSMALLPDGHSVLPSLLIMGLATVLAYYLPHRFRSEFNNRGLLSYRMGSQEPAKAWFLRRWVPPFTQSAEHRL